MPIERHVVRRSIGMFSDETILGIGLTRDMDAVPAASRAVRHRYQAVILSFDLCKPSDGCGQVKFANLPFHSCQAGGPGEMKKGCMAHYPGRLSPS
jgi:hypothetical protein